MWLFWTVACVFILIGFIAYLNSKEINAIEFLVGGGIALLIAGIFHSMAYFGSIYDTETWSGEVLEVVHEPEWVEMYTTTETHTSGNRTWTTTETHFRTHPEQFYARDTLSQTITLTEAQHRHYVDEFYKFGCKVAKRRGHRPGHVSGDVNDYYCNTPGLCFAPTTASKHFENRVKAGPSAFAFDYVSPKDKSVPDYPDNSNRLRSARLVWRASRDISTLEWDKLNSRLGPSKKVNLILVGFTDADSSVVRKLQAKWIGGKKNDLVLCYGRAADGSVAWADVFGWTKSELCKAELRTILLGGPISDAIIPKIEKAVLEGYTIRDWSEFNYLQIEPPLWSYLTFFTILVLYKVIFFWVVLTNRHSKDSHGRRSPQGWRGGRRKGWQKNLGAVLDFWQ